MNDKWTTVSKVVVKVSLGLCAGRGVYVYQRTGHRKWRSVDNSTYFDYSGSYFSYCMGDVHRDV